MRMLLAAAARHGLELGLQGGLDWPFGGGFAIGPARLGLEREAP